MQSMTKKGLISLKEFKVEVSSPNEGLQASLSILLQHVAEFHIALIETIAEHYELDADEIIEVVKNHPRTKEIATHPLLEEADLLVKPKIVKFSKKLKKPIQPSSK